MRARSRQIASPIRKSRAFFLLGRTSNAKAAFSLLQLPSPPSGLVALSTTSEHAESSELLPQGCAVSDSEGAGRFVRSPLLDFATFPRESDSLRRVRAVLELVPRVETGFGPRRSAVPRSV